MGKCISSPWLLARDFNQALNQEDKRGGRPVTYLQSQSLWEVIEDCNLMDLGFLGPRFTWTNNREDEVKEKELIGCSVITNGS